MNKPFRRFKLKIKFLIRFNMDFLISGCNDLIRSLDFIPVFFNTVVNSKIHTYLMNHFFETSVLLDGVICSIIFLKHLNRPGS